MPRSSSVAVVIPPPLYSESTTHHSIIAQPLPPNPSLFTVLPSSVCHSKPPHVAIHIAPEPIRHALASLAAATTKSRPLVISLILSVSSLETTSFSLTLEPFPSLCGVRNQRQIALFLG